MTPTEIDRIATETLRRHAFVQRVIEARARVIQAERAYLLSRDEARKAGCSDSEIQAGVNFIERSASR